MYETETWKFAIKRFLKSRPALWSRGAAPALLPPSGGGKISARGGPAGATPAVNEPEGSCADWLEGGLSAEGDLCFKASCANV